MAVTLMQMAIDQRVDNLEGSFIQMYDQYSPVFSEAPMEPTDELYYDFERVVTLPSVAWRAFNTAWTESSGVTNTFREYGKVLGGEVKIEKHFANGPRGARTITKQTRMKILASINEWDRAFFEGSELNSPNEMVGLRNRLTGNQLVLNASGGGTLSLAKLDELLDAVPFTTQDPAPGMKKGETTTKCLYMPRPLRRKLTTLLDAVTGARRLEVTRNGFGQQVTMYGEAVIKVVEEAGTGNSILGFDEDPGDGTADCASIYCVAWGDEQFKTFYRRPSTGDGKMLSIFRVPEMETEPRSLLRFEGIYGIVAENPRSAARLYAITNT